MKITNYGEVIKSDKVLNLCFDISKANLNLFALFEHENRMKKMESKFANKTDVIRAKLIDAYETARELGFESVRILFEHSGNYGRKLNRVAELLNYEVGGVNTEHVHKLKNVENNDPTKSDIKDPRVISMIARLGKTMRVRKFEGEFQLLRDLHGYYNDEEVSMVSVKNKIHALLTNLYPDYEKKPSFTFEGSGRFLMELYHFNPYRIMKDGFEVFCSQMKKAVPKIYRRTLEELFEMARTSVETKVDPSLVETMEARMNKLWEELVLHQERIKEMKKQMTALYNSLEAAKKVPSFEGMDLSAFQLACIIAETGPLSDFHSSSALLRYAGVNLCPRESGLYKGKTKISKKGRPLLRKALATAIFTLMRKRGLFGTYYLAKKSQGKKRPLALVAMMRKLLKVLYGTYKSGGVFDINRVFQCASRLAA